MRRVAAQTAIVESAAPRVFASASDPHAERVAPGPFWRAARSSQWRVFRGDIGEQRGVLDERVGQGVQHEEFLAARTLLAGPLDRGGAGSPVRGLAPSPSVTSTTAGARTSPSLLRTAHVCSVAYKLEGPFLPPDCVIRKCAGQ